MAIKIDPMRLPSPTYSIPNRTTPQEEFASLMQQRDSVRSGLPNVSDTISTMLGKPDFTRTMESYQNMLRPQKAEKSVAPSEMGNKYSGYYGGLGGSFGNSYSGGLGIGAYGFKGITGTAATKGNTQYGLQPEFDTALKNMFRDMQAAGIQPPGIGQGFRSYEGQVAAKERWTRAGNPSMAATPGRSVHGLGLAADLTDGNGNSLTQAQYDWMIRNAGRYGIVNLPSERWHWQYDPQRWRGRSQGQGGASNISRAVK